VCRSAQKFEFIEEDEVASYLGAVDHPQLSTWTEIFIFGGQLHFKVDTGASVTATPESEYSKGQVWQSHSYTQPSAGPVQPTAGC